MPSFPKFSHVNTKLTSNTVARSVRFSYIIAYHSTDAIMGYAQPQPFTPTISLHGLTIKAFLHTRPILRKVKFIADSKELTFSYEFNISWYAPVWMIQLLTSPLHIPKEVKFIWIRIPGGLKFLTECETAYRVSMSQKLKALVCVGMSQNLKLVCVVMNPNPKYAKAKTNSKCFDMPRYESKFKSKNLDMSQKFKLVCVGVNANLKYAKAKTNCNCFGMRRYDSKFKSQDKSNKGKIISKFFWYASVWVKIYKSRQIKQGNFGCIP